MHLLQINGTCSSQQKHGDRNSIIFPLQYGFCKNMSYEQQLLGFTSDLHKNLDEGRQTDAIIMDFSKAFNKVGHQRLLHKLQFYGVRGKNLGWIQSFLHGRSQRVLLDGNNSSSIAVESGVPQGSVLGPCLFLFYINDLPNGLASKVRLFADDAISYMTIDNQHYAHNLQQDLNRIRDRAEKWMIVLNTDKCKVLTVSRKRSKAQHTCVSSEEHTPSPLKPVDLRSTWVLPSLLISSGPNISISCQQSQ